MFRTLYEDLSFIENKYHRTDEPFDPYRRMKYHGYEYDPSTGLDDAQMHEALSRLNEEVKLLPHPAAKARLFAFVLDHARIDVNEKDWFAGFFNWGRVLQRYTVKPWKTEVFAGMPRVSEEMALLDETGTAAMWPDFDHVIPHWDNLLSLGFPGLLERVRRYHADRGTPENESFYRGIEISYEAIIRLLDRYYRYALTKNHSKAAMQAQCFLHLRDGKPKNLYEALQAMYLFFILCECVDHYQTRSLGNGIDSTLRPFYDRDIRTGAFTREEEKEFMAYFFMQFSAIGNYWGHPMYMGGTNPDGSTRISDISYAVLEIYRELRIYNPKIQIKVAENTPKAFLYQVYDLIRSGVSPFVFCCEPAFRRAMTDYGATEEEARDFEISGCYESRVKAGESSAVSGYINTPKAVELVIFGGRDRRTGKTVGRETDLSSLKSFEDFYAAFLAQWGDLIERTVVCADAFESRLEYINPSNLYSATVKSALEKGLDGYARGVKYCNSSILNCGFASAVDSVMAVKKLCFDTAAVSLCELRDALDRDWEGFEKLRLKALNLPCKYGNGDPETDELAAKMSAFFCSKVNDRPNARGGTYKALMHSAMQFVWQGAKTAALPDGRKACGELSKNASPVNGADKNGVTALILSACGLTPYTYRESFCLDLLLHPSAAEGDEGLAAMDGLIMTYLKKGGMAIQFNIFRADMLRDAQKHPEKYRNLQVRVCGWNVLWNNLSGAEQNAYILRAESVE